MIYPLLWMVGSSFKPTNEIFSDLGPVPQTLDRATTSTAGRDDAAVHPVLHQLAPHRGLAVVGNVFACSLAAYAFARLDFRVQAACCFALMLGTIMLPPHATLIPQYILFLNLGWVNTFLPLMVPKFLAVDAFFIFLMVQFIRAHPARAGRGREIDGCGPVRIFCRIILPLIRPGAGHHRRSSPSSGPTTTSSPS